MNEDDDKVLPRKYEPYDRAKSVQEHAISKHIHDSYEKPHYVHEDLGTPIIDWMGDFEFVMTCKVVWDNREDSAPILYGTQIRRLFAIAQLVPTDHMQEYGKYRMTSVDKMSLVMELALSKSRLKEHGAHLRVVK